MARIFGKDGADVTFVYGSTERALNQWHEAHRADFVKSGYTNLLNTFDTQEEKHGHVGDKYMRLDVGSSGAWMVELATGLVFGIKGYGKVDKKKIAGNIYAPDFDGTVLFRDRFRHGRFDNREDSMTRQEKRHAGVANVVRRLKNDGNASEYIQKILSDQQFKLWLDTWVIAPLEMLNQTDEQLKDDYMANENFNAGMELSR